MGWGSGSLLEVISVVLVVVVVVVVSTLGVVVFAAVDLLWVVGRLVVVDGVVGVVDSSTLT